MLNIPSNLAAAIRLAPAGTRVRGTFDARSRCGSLLCVDGAKTDQFVYAVVGRVDQSDAELPLAIERHGDSLVARDHAGILQVCEYGADAFNGRNPLDPDIQGYLKDRRVLIVGQGSIGSELGAAVGLAGVGQIAGNDPDCLEIHNCMRHVLGPEYIGWNKAAGMASWMAVHCQGCRFTALPRDLFSGDRSELRNFLGRFRPHLIAAVTDSKSVQLLAQAAAIHTGATYFAMGCFNNAIEGEVFIRLPRPPTALQNDSTGYACYEELHPPGKGERAASQYDYSTDEPGRYAGEPALGHLIRHKTLFAATLLIDTLLYDAPVDTRSAALTRNHLRRGAQYVRIGTPRSIGMKWITHPSRQRIIVEADMLSSETAAVEPVGRAGELNHLKSCASPVFKTERPLNAWLHGPAGSGKTLLAGLARQQVRSASDVRVAAHVNCWRHRSLHSVLQAIIDELQILGAESQDTNVKFDRIRHIKTTVCRSL